MMGDRDEWQVAGGSRRRRHHANSFTPKTTGSARSKSAGGHRPSQSPPAAANRKVSGRTRSQHEAAFSYKQTANGNSRRRGRHSATVDERVKDEIDKLERLAVLLKKSVLWERLVENLEFVLSALQLGTNGDVASTRQPPSDVGNRDDDSLRSSLSHHPLHPTVAAPEVLGEKLFGRATSGIESKGEDCCGAPHKGNGVPPHSQSTDMFKSKIEPKQIHSAMSKATVHLEPADGEAKNPSSRAQAEYGEGSAQGFFPKRVCELVCYGIGNFSGSHNSRYQLALVLCLRDLLFPPEPGSNDRSQSCHEAARAQRNDHKTGEGEYGIQATLLTEAVSIDDAKGRREELEEFDGKPNAAGSHASMLVFDPIMGCVEKAVLAKLGCGVIEVNEQGKRCSCGQGRCRPTLFFMPHCPMRLYSNVLWANWSFEALGSTIILGNSLAAYRDKLVPADVAKDASNAIARTEHLIQEIQLHPYRSADKTRWKKDDSVLPHAEFAFNDLSLSYSRLELRKSAAGQKALQNPPKEFVEDSDGELVTGKAGNASHLD